jgi:hypothetical protein
VVEVDAASSSARDAWTTVCGRRTRLTMALILGCEPVEAEVSDSSYVRLGACKTKLVGVANDDEETEPTEEANRLNDLSQICMTRRETSRSGNRRSYGLRARSFCCLRYNFSSAWQRTPQAHLPNVQLGSPRSIFVTHIARFTSIMIPR